MVVFAHFFSSCCPDLGCIGLWGHEQAVQQSNHLCRHAVCNVPADERPHWIRPGQETKTIPFKTTEGKASVVNKIQTHKKKEVYEQPGYLWECYKSW